MRKRSQCWADTPQALSAKDAGGTAAFYVCISSVRTPEGRRQLEKLKATSKSLCCCHVRAYRPTANSIQVILHSILPRLPWSFSNILHICFYKPLLGFLFFFLVSLPIDVHSYKESTAIYCAKLESMNRKVSSFISAVSIGVWRITKDSMNNMNNLMPWKTRFWKGNHCMPASLYLMGQPLPHASLSHLFTATPLWEKEKDDSIFHPVCVSLPAVRDAFLKFIFIIPSLQVFALVWGY